jgi:hypothetical protein
MHVLWFLVFEFWILIVRACLGVLALCVSFGLMFLFSFQFSFILPNEGITVCEWCEQYYVYFPVTARIRNLHDYQLRLLHNIVPVPSGVDIANTLKYFSQTLLSKSVTSYSCFFTITVQTYEMILIVILLVSCTKGCPKLSNGDVEISGKGFCTSWIISHSGL